ncbi:Colipase-like protein 2 [Manis javanica]|nr:Colipase-like protein 2 [Manis javanica]
MAGKLNIRLQHLGFQDLCAPRGDPAALLERVGQVYQGVSEGEWVECSHHSECFSDCCLMNLDVMAAFCAPKTRINKVCLPQTKGAINILCPCQMALSCHSKDVILCPRGCYLI